MSVRHYDDPPAYLRGVCDGCGTMGPRVETSFNLGRDPRRQPEKFAVECKLARETAGFVEAWTPVKRRRVEFTTRDLCPVCAAKPLQPGEYIPCRRCGWPRNGMLHAAACTALAIREAEHTPTPAEAEKIYRDYVTAADAFGQGGDG